MVGRANRRRVGSSRGGSRELRLAPTIPAGGEVLGGAGMRWDALEACAPTGETGGGPPDDMTSQEVVEVARREREDPCSWCSVSLAVGGNWDGAGARWAGLARKEGPCGKPGPGEQSGSNYSSTGSARASPHLRCPLKTSEKQPD